MADDLAQQILSPVQADNNVKAMAWDAFHRSKDANDLAVRLKVLGIPDSAKADLWDAKAGHYSPNPTQGLAGVARPNVNPETMTIGDALIPDTRSATDIQRGIPGSFEGHPENIGQYVPATAGRAIEGATDISRGNVAMGTRKLIQAPMNAVTPAAPVLAAASPMMALRGLLGGAITGQGAQFGASALGASQDQAGLAGDIGNLFGGFAASTGLARSLLQTPLKNFVAEHGETLTNILEPRKFLLSKIRSIMSGGSAEIPAPAPSTVSPPTVSPQPQTTLPNATYLRDDIQSISQQPPQPKPDLLEGIREHLRLSKIQEELNAQTGSGADIVDQRMAQYAKTPWENQSITVPAKVTVGSKAASDADTSLFQKARSVLGENASISQVAQLAQKMKTESQVPIPQEAAQYLPQPVTNQSNLADLLTRSIRMARSRK